MELSHNTIRMPPLLNYNAELFTQRVDLKL
jgi:hypothetical protein